MKTIGFFNSTKSWGGGEKWHYDAAVYFYERGYPVHFFLTEESELHKKLQHFADIRIHFVKVRSFSFLNPFFVKKLASVFQSSCIDTLMVSLSTDLKIAGRAAKAAKVAKVVYVRAVPIPIKNTILNRYIFSRWVTFVIANSIATAASIVHHNADLVRRDRIKLIYNPIQTDRFIDRSYEKLYERRLDEIIIGSAGRLEKEKNHKFFIDLSAELKRQNIAHTILIAGTGSLEGELKQMVRANGLENNFIFTGFLKNVKDLLKSCDIFILPSLFEGFGFVLAEASLCEIPVIAFDTSSIPEVVVNGETGFVVRLNSVGQVIEKILLLKSNPDLAAQMGIAGRKYIRENFDENKIMNELSEFLSLH